MMTAGLITKERCLPQEKPDFLPRYIGTGWSLMHFEAYVYAHMARHAQGYRGGLWELYSLSNGGFFIALRADEEQLFRVTQPSNLYKGDMSAEAASIGMNLYTLSAFSYYEERFGTLFHKLLQYAYQHDEACEIAGFID